MAHVGSACRAVPMSFPARPILRFPAGPILLGRDELCPCGPIVAFLLQLSPPAAQLPSCTETRVPESKWFHDAHPGRLVDVAASRARLLNWTSLRRSNFVCSGRTALKYVMVTALSHHICPFVLVEGMFTSHEVIQDLGKITDISAHKPSSLKEKHSPRRYQIRLAASEDRSFISCNFNFPSSVHKQYMGISRHR